MSEAYRWAFHDTKKRSNYDTYEKEVDRSSRGTIEHIMMHGYSRSTSMIESTLGKLGGR